MKLTIEGIKDRAAWEKAGIALPGYDVEKISEKAKEEPGWVHFGIGNIFRIFIGGIADGLLEEGVLDRGITCVETFDYDVVDKIYDPYDNLGLSVILHGDGTREYKVLGSLAEAVKAQSSDLAQWNRLKEIFTSKSLQMVSFTITEKGYALQKADGTWFPFVEADIKNGPDKATGAMAVLVAMLYERFKAGRYPIALVSMDNCSKNGAKLRESVLTMAEEWKKQGFVDDDFITYVSDEKVVAFPWTMIDKITPRPSEQIADDLEALGVEKMQPVITGKKTYIAPFVNAEKPQYLVIEDSFPNGRPALEKGFGVYMADRNTVNLSEAFIIPFSVMFRFFPTISEEAGSIGNAMRMRGITGKNFFKNPQAVLEYRIVPLMMSVVTIGNDLSAAALTRGLGNGKKRTSICKIGFHWKDFALMIIVTAALLVFLLF